MASKSLTQAYQAQDAAYEALMRYVDQCDKKDELSPQDASAINTLISALDRAQDRVRIHRRVPLPGVAKQVTSKKLKSGGRDVSAFLASLAPQQDQAGDTGSQGSDEPTGDPAAEQPDPDQEQSSGT